MQSTPCAIGQRDTLLDHYMPSYDVAKRHRTLVHAPAPVTWDAACALDLHRSALIRAIFAGRELLMRAPSPGQAPPRPFLAEALELGWKILAEEPGRELVMGAVTQPWEAQVTFRGLEPDAFAEFQDPGYAKIVWAIAVAPLGPGRCMFITETRVATTDPGSRARFKRYWLVFSPGILLIRREILRLVKRAAERRFAQETG